MVLHVAWCLVLLGVVVVVVESPGLMIGLFDWWTILGCSSPGCSSLVWTMCWLSRCWCASLGWHAMKPMSCLGLLVIAKVGKTKMCLVEANVLVGLVDLVVSVVVVPLVVVDCPSVIEPASMTASAVVNSPCLPLIVVVVCHHLL